MEDEIFRRGGDSMTRPYLILVNGVLWERKMTLKFAQKVARELNDKGVKAVVAYDHEGKYNAD
jgi:N-acetylmuramoyl-L-alanine amidase